MKELFYKTQIAILKGIIIGGLVGLVVGFIVGTTINTGIGIAAGASSALGIGMVISFLSLRKLVAIYKNDNE